MNQRTNLSWQILRAEPFRIFFVGATAAGIAGVGLWPLYFSGLRQFYPGQSHSRMMAYGFFGGFILGFLGTALPRMLSVESFRSAEMIVLLSLYGTMVVATFIGKTMLGDVLFLALVAVFAAFMIPRFRARKDVPPPGFVLVLLGLACAWAGAILSILQEYSETAFFWGVLQHLLAYQGFVLLPILGVGPFLLPRFFGSPSNDSFPESVRPPAGWTKRAFQALATGLIIIISFWMEAAQMFRAGPALRCVVSMVYLAREIPLFRASKERNTMTRLIRLAVILLLGGFVAGVILPGYRVSLLHLTLIGGFAVINFVVSTRVIYGHSGNLELLARPNRWLWVAISLMLLAMVTRITGDFVPKVLATHYSYGAALWIAAVLIWSVKVLPKVLKPDPGD